MEAVLHYLHGTVLSIAIETLAKTDATQVQKVVAIFGPRPVTSAEVAEAPSSKEVNWLRIGTEPTEAV